MRENHILSPIPQVLQPDVSGISIVPAEEPLVCISEEYRDVMDFQPMYFEQGIPGAISRVYVRQTVARMLLEAARALPAGFRLKIYDAWRPAAVQKALYSEYYDRLCRQYAGTGKTEAQLRQMASLFVSYPSEDPDAPFVHSTGGAVDLTIVDPSGKELDMGTAFDDFTEAAYTAHFENTGSEEIRNNRRLLYHIMSHAGFTNLPSEWWHYDFGDRMWAAINKRNSIYRGIYTEPGTQT